MAKKKVWYIKVVEGGISNYEVGRIYEFGDDAIPKLLLENHWGVEVTGVDEYDNFLVEAHKFIKTEDDLVKLAGQLGFDISDEESEEQS